MTIDFKNISPADTQNYLQHAIAPRPICLASTIDKKGNINLSPFSFFNLFSTNPPIVIFSAARRVRDNSTKHTLQNVLEVPEVVINLVDFDIVQQTSLASCEYAKGTNEFIKAGLTMQMATLIKPPMVKESKIKLECKVIEIKPLGTQGGAGNLIIAEVLLMHLHQSILDADNKIEPTKWQLVARLGGDWYCKINETNLFKVAKPNTQLGMGIDALPTAIKTSTLLNGNNLAQLANASQLPIKDAEFRDDTLKNIIQKFSANPIEMEKELHSYAKQLLTENKVAEAWQVLLAL